MQNTALSFPWRLHLFVGLFCLVATVSCTRKTAETPDIIVLQTGRLRGNISPEGVRNAGALQHYAYIAGYVKKVREEAARDGTPVLLVDLGDSLTGSFAASVTQSANVATFFNEMHYDAIMLGNLDAYLSPESLKALQMPVLCPFLDGQGQPALPGTVLDTTIQKGQIKVQLVANFFGDTKMEDARFSFPSVFGQAHDIQPLRDYAALVQRLPSHGNDTLRILQSLKFEHEGREAPAFLTTLKNLGFDFVAAHRVYSSSKTDSWVTSSNYGWQPPVSLNILRENRGFALARADLKRVDGKWVMQKQEVLPMLANTAKADEEIVKKLLPFKNAIIQADKPVLYLGENLPKSAVFQLYLNALASVPGTMAVISQTDTVRADWQKGEVNLSDVYNSLPWSDAIVQFELSHEEYAEVLGNKRNRVFALPEAATAPKVTVVTSEYFAHNIADNHKWAYPETRFVDTVTEHQFFANYLRNTFDPGQNPNSPPGWSLLDSPAVAPQPTP